MEYQKMINSLDNASNQPSKFRTKNRVKIIDNSRGTCNTNSHIKFKMTMLKSSFYDYSNGYILVKGRITITGEGKSVGARQPDERNRRVMFTNFIPFTNFLSKIDNTQIDNGEGLDLVLPMYSLIEYSDNYSEKSASLW